MYGPKERVKVHLFLIGSMVLFVGALAAPLLVDDTIVRTGFGGADGFRVQGGDIDDLVSESPLETGLRPPNVLLQTPALSADATFRVAWDSDGPDPMFVYGYHLQYHTIDEEGGGDWEDWFSLRRSDLPREALFSGAPDTTYGFRARACMLGLDCGPWSETSNTQVLHDATAPVIQLLLEPKDPMPEQIVDGQTAIRWTHDHRGPGDAMVGVSIRSADGNETLPIYSGQGRSVAWDTTRHDDGRYVIRLEVRDGAHSIHHEVPVTVANDRGAVLSPEPSETGDPDDGPTPETAEAPAGLGSLLPLGILGVALLLRRVG